jgi:muramoyltetrapeptide carboxypeptidase
MNLLPLSVSLGDTLGVVAPSNPVNAEVEAQFSTGIKTLEAMGFSLLIGDHVRSLCWGHGAAPQEKADDLNRMFADRTVKAVICAQGGDTANACLPYLDWECIHANPKIFLGISDITVLLNAISHKTGLVTFHGNDVIWGFGRNPQAYDREEFLNRFVNGMIGEVPPRMPRHAVRAGQAEGVLLGGNLRCLLKLAGTPYFPDFRGSILFLESLHAAPADCEAAFSQLRQIGIFEKVRGVLVGYIYGMQKEGSSQSEMERVLLKVTSGYDFPIMKMNEFGHNCPNTVLPVGARVRMDTMALTLEITQNCVEV